MRLTNRSSDIALSSVKAFAFPIGCGVRDAGCGLRGAGCGMRNAQQFKPGVVKIDDFH